jgi:hypothetical protein
MRKIQFQTGKYYHVYNRGVDKRDIFLDEKDFIRFLRSIREFNRADPIGSLYELDYKKNVYKGVKPPIGGLTPFPAVASDKLVEIVCYCLNKNHYHFLLKQLVENGISKFMKKIGTGCTCYFNKKYSRSGSLFQGTFKATPVKKYGYLLKLLVYVNCNYEVHGLGRRENWLFSSYLDSVGARNGTLCNFNIIKSEFGNLENFKKFCEDALPEIKNIKELQKYLLE